MFHLPEDQNAGCERFLDEIELAPGELTLREELLAEVSVQSRRHAESCTNCTNALMELIATREALRPMREETVEANPWFATRVMALIAAHEKEIDEQVNGVWIFVRRMAPRIVAFCALLLVVGSTWALQLKKAEERHRTSTQAAEGLFYTAPTTPVNDDAMSIVGGEPRP
jgi:hypothetical protein